MYESWDINLPGFLGLEHAIHCVICCQRNLIVPDCTCAFVLGGACCAGLSKVRPCVVAFKGLSVIPAHLLQALSLSFFVHGPGNGLYGLMYSTSEEES